MSCTGTVAGNYVVTASGSTGTLSHSASFTVQVTDFAISANPTSTNPVLVGTITTSTITLTQANGFAGIVTLVQSPSPSAGLSCSLNPSNITVGPLEATSTLLCTGSGPHGVYLVTVTATSGQISHSIIVRVTVQDFTIVSSVSSVTVNAGAKGNSTITVASQDLFSQVVTFAASFSPSGLTCAFNPASVTPAAGSSATSVLSCSSSTATTYTVVVTGTSGGLSHSTTVIYTIQDFTLSPDQISVGVNAGNQAASTITATSLNRWSGTVSLSFSTSSATGISCTASPMSIVDNTGSILSCSGQAGSYTVTMNGVSGQLSHSVTVSFTFRDFSVTSNPSSQTVVASSPAVSTIILAPRFGFTGTVRLDLSVSPPTGLACNFDSSIVNLAGSGTSTLTCTGSAGRYTVTVTGTSTGLQATTIFGVIVQEPTIQSSPSFVTVPAGTRGNSTITLAGQNLFTGNASLTVSNFPGINCGLSALTVPIVSGNPVSVALQCTGSVAGIYRIQVNANFGSSAPPQSATITYTIQDFTLQSSQSSVTVNADNTASVSVNVTSVNGFAGRVVLSPTVTPSSGLVCNLSSTSLTLQVSGTRGLTCVGSAGTYAVRVIATSGTVSHSSTITVTVQDFRISSSSTQVSLVSGASSTPTIIVSSMNGFGGNATLVISNNGGSDLANSLSLTSFVLVPGSNSTSVLTISTGGLSPGTYSVRVDGTVFSSTTGMLSRSLVLTVLVTPAPSIHVPDTFSVSAGSTLRFDVNVTDADLGRTVTLSASGLPPGANFSPALGSATFSGIFSWTPSSGDVDHDYNVTFTADDGHGGLAVSHVLIHVSARASSGPLLTGNQYWFLGLAGFAVAVMSPLVIRVVRRTMGRGKTALAFSGSDPGL
ncbi:MAG TPA: hypothetical protein VE177_07875 [Candidatus Binatus sp.]|nr:hypothetical protein [Candidatus Binatus sp.]